MFTKPNIPIYLDGIEPAIGKDKDGDEQRDTILSFRIHPVSPELATDLDPFVRAALWTLGNVDPSEKTKAITFELHQPAFSLEFRAAPDTSRVAFAAAYAKLEKSTVHARKHRDVSGWALTFKVRLETPDAKGLATLYAGYTHQHFLTFAPAEPDLISSMERDAPAVGSTADVH